MGDALEPCGRMVHPRRGTVRETMASTPGGDLAADGLEGLVWPKEWTSLMQNWVICSRTLPKVEKVMTPSSMTCSKIRKGQMQGGTLADLDHCCVERQEMI